MSTLFDGNVLDQNKIPVPGAQVYIYASDGQLASLVDELGQSITQPVVAGEDGYWSAFVEDEGYYTFRYFWGGRERLISANEIAGRSPLQIVQASAAYAEAMNGPTYSTVASGLAATSNGQGFAVDNGDGTVTVYLNVAGAAVSQRTLATKDFLASLLGAGAIGLASGGKVQDAIDYVTPEMRGTVGDGSTNDTVNFAAAISASAGKALLLSASTYAIASASTVVGGAMRGRGSAFTKLKRIGSGNLITGADRVGERIEGVTLDMNRTALGNAAGHGISMTGEYLTFRDIVVKDFGSDGTGGGAGILVGPSAAYPNPKGIRMEECSFFPDPASAISLGWILGDATHSFVNGIYTEGAVSGLGYGHELKDNARFVSLNRLIAKNCNVAVGFGQQTPGVDGCDYNVLTNWIGDGTDMGFLSSEGFGNVSVGSIHSTTGGPGNVSKWSIPFTGGSIQNSVFAHATFGSMDRTAYFSGDRHFVEVVAHDTASIIAEFTTGSDKNVVRVAHPGQRTSILGAITDNSGFALDSSNANVVWSEATGERVGSISGRFRDKLGTSGATPLTAQNWIYEHGQFVFQTMMTPGNSGDISGISFNTARDGNNTGRFWHITAPAVANNYLTFGVGGTSDVARIYRDQMWVNAILRPTLDNVSSLGTASFRWNTVFAGTGTINTSDERLKDDISDIPDDWLDAWGDVDWQRYKFKEAIEGKGDAARWHVGLIAQKVEAAFKGRGLDAFEIGLLCCDPVIEKQIETYIDTREVTETVEVTEIIVDIVDGKATEREVTNLVERPVTKQIPVLDENGEQVMRVVPKFDEDGTPLPRSKDDQLEPKFVSVPVTEEYEAEREIEVDTGEVRYGLRYTEAFALEAAWVRRELQRVAA